MIGILLAAILSSCQEKQQYEILVERYLNDHLKDPGSYQNIELGSPKIITPMSKALEETTRRVGKGDLQSDSIPYKLEEIRAYFESQGTEPYDTLGWEIRHKYRSRNSNGSLELVEVIYTLDRSLSKIIKVQSK